MEPCLLALDSSTEVMALALHTPAGEWLLHQEEGGPRVSARLVPAALALLAQAGLMPRSLDAVAFGQGPGAFTGLRAACAVAQGLAFGLGRPVLPLCSLLVVAEDACVQQPPASDDEVHWVAMDARMDEAYAAAWRRTAGGWVPAQAPALYTLPALAARWQAEPPTRIAGSAIAAFGPRLPSGNARCLSQEHDRAAALGRLALAAWRAGAGIDPSLALPLYLRDKVALTTAERAQAQGGSR